MLTLHSPRVNVEKGNFKSKFDNKIIERNEEVFLRNKIPGSLYTTVKIIFICEENVRMIEMIVLILLSQFQVTDARKQLSDLHKIRHKNHNSYLHE